MGPNYVLMWIVLSLWVSVAVKAFCGFVFYFRKYFSKYPLCGLYSCMWEAHFIASCSGSFSSGLEEDGLSLQLWDMKEGHIFFLQKQL